MPSNEMFKFFDHHGNTLVLRPDMTPAVARSAAKYFAGSRLPVKVFYEANTFVNHENYYRGQLKENTIVGAELIGNNDADEDFEIICMAIESMKAAGLENFQVEIGNIRFFKGLLKEAGINEEDEERLVGLINKKNFLGVEELISELSVSGSAAEALVALPELFGNVGVLDKAASLTRNRDSLEALDRLAKLYERLKSYGYEDYVSFDLGSLSSHTYYTGIIFHAFTFGTGDAVLSGGRYDDLLQQFGKDAPSIGFAIVIDELMSALNRQQIGPDSPVDRVMVIYPVEYQENAVSLGRALRNANVKTELIRKSTRHALTEYLAHADRNRVKMVYFFLSENRVLCCDRLARTQEEKNISDIHEEDF